MKKIVVAGLLVSSLGAQAFLDFNSYGPGYNDNDWPIWTPMYWMEKMTDNDKFSQYGYPYNNRPFNVGASQFNMSQMPTPDQAYRAESPATPAPTYMTPAAMSFANPNKAAQIQLVHLQSPYSRNYNFVEPRRPSWRGF